MHFSEQEITLAKRLKQLGLVWEPQAGNYVYDPTEFCQQPSPFQERVYFILNYNYFMKAVGGVDRFKEIMVWLPTWSDARHILRGMGVDDDAIAAHLQQQQAIEQGTERLALYQLIELLLRTSASATAP